MRALRLALVSLTAGTVLSAPHAAQAASTDPGPCPPHATALHFSDALDKLTDDGATLGGLSDMAYDRRSGGFVSTVDNHLTDPARIWFYRSATRPVVTRPPLVLRRPDGTAYTGLDSDNEGLAVLPNGDFLVSSETEPSIRIYGRDGVQKSSLPVPARFDVAPAGQATANATLEGLTITPSGDRVIAAMEGTLSGDTGDGTFRRFLVYGRGTDGRFRLTKQIAYQVDPGMRISEIAAYSEDRLVVLEASYSPSVGNVIRLQAVTTVGTAPNVSSISDLSTRPQAVMAKTLVADVTACPTLGATAKQFQTNPLMDNYEGMAVAPTRNGGPAALDLISDDNFGATQITRVLTLIAVLP